MSRIGKQPIELPEGTVVKMEGRQVTLTGPKGELSMTVHPSVAVDIKEKEIVCAVAEKGGSHVRNLREARALWGTTRARLANMVQGVNEGWRRELTLVGVGYRAQLKGKDLELAVGYSHPVLIEAPEGITFGVEKESVSVEGIDNVLVGQVAANIRAVRKPEPYKGKGIRYKDEVVRRKVGKVAGSTE